jgi:hypothetical protein
MYYSEFVATLPLDPPLDPEAYALAAMLDEISRSEGEAGHGILSAVVISKEANKPGAGFFDLARRLGRQSQSDDELWIAELP